MKNVLDGTQQALKFLSADREQLAFGDGFDAGLSDRVLHQGYLAEVLLLLVFEYNVLLVCLLVQLLCNQVALDDKVQSIAIFALFHDVLIGLETFLL